MQIVIAFTTATLLITPTITTAITVVNRNNKYNNACIEQKIII